MIKSINRTLLLCLIIPALVLGVSSCKKSSPAAVKSRTELVSQAAWKVVKAETKIGSGAWINNTTTKSCELDDNYIFRSNGTYEINEGATKCSPSDPQISETGTWSFQTNETQFAIISTGSSSTDTFSIDQLDEATFMITITSGSGGSIYYDRLTFGH